MHITSTDADVTAKAVRLGVIREGEELPRHLRSKVLAALIQEQEGEEAQGVEPQTAKEIVIQPDGVILVDGEPFPWLVARQPMEVSLNPGGLSTVRLTLIAEAVQIIKPEPREEPR